MIGCRAGSSVWNVPPTRKSPRLLTEFSEPLLVEPQPSRILQALTIAVHFVALMPVVLLPMPGWGRLLWLVAALSSLCWEWRRHVGPSAIAALPSFRCIDG